MQKKIQNKATPASRQGFTLIEILVVIGLIAILAGVVLIAINPARQFAQARNSQRVSNVTTIMNALGQDLAEHKGVSSCTSITNSTTTIGTGGTDLSTCLSLYIASGIPMDPVASSSANTLYEISVNSSGRYTICAPKHAEAVLGTSVYCLVR
ncbi:type II secretion system protein [Candidatus Kaiserbacteria bacterium]|nr:type II secretion system protein [Candidatus Kaiserbacteria bacterium]